MALGLFILYLILCFSNPSYLFFLPLISYDAIYLKLKGIWYVSFLILFFNDPLPNRTKWVIGAFILLTYVLKNRTKALETLEKDYKQLRDTTKEISIQLEKQNKELMEKQDDEIHLATLKERNRIARDIHDNVGHLLSRTLLQIGALLVITRDKAIHDNLLLIKSSLSEAMDSIRNSVHNLHEKSINLQIEIQKLIHNFNFCSIQFHNEIETELEKNLKNCFITITKEALSNVIKHSNATEVIINMREHPALYQLVIQDNGVNPKINTEGMGLKNIADRVTAVNGNLNISTDKGFKLFISVPK
jgi:signal transduction histidine kinase